MTMKVFKYTTVTDENVVIDGDKVRCFFPFFNDKMHEKVEYVKTSCSCTTSRISQDGIELVYNRRLRDGSLRRGHVRRQLAKVYLKDGKPLWYTNEKGVRSPNHNKSFVNLMLDAVLS